MPKIKNVFKWVNGLPDEYQAVEYIESSGNAYINSGYSPNTSPYFQLQFKGQQVSNIQNNDYIYGAGVSSNNWVTLENSNGFYWNAGQTTGIGTHQVSIGTDFEYDVKYNNGTLIISGTQTGTYNYNVGNGLGTGEFQFFGTGAHNRYMNAKIYYFKMYSGQNFDLIRNFVPCYRKSDSVIGMYDVIGQQFYTNAGSGAFTKGSDVSYIGLVQKEIYPGHKGFVPGVNTRIYLPLTDNYKDVVSGTTLSTTGTVSLVTEGGVKCVRLNGGRLYGLSSAVITGNGARTLNFWFKYNSINTSEWGSVVSWGSESNYSFTSLGDNGGVAYSFSGYSASADIESGTSLSNGAWYNMVATYDGNTLAIYLNGALIGNKSVNLTTGSSDLYIGGRPSGSCIVNGWINNVIVENKAWTAQEITDYYNMTKSDFGI